MAFRTLQDFVESLERFWFAEQKQNSYPNLSIRATIPASNGPKLLYRMDSSHF